jgi:hypothetical protein
LKYLLITVLFAFLLMPVSSHALSAYGIQIDSATVIDGQTLHLNGFGLRTKMFGKVYVGSLYLPRQITKSAEVINDPGVKLVRINFLHKRVLKDKFVEALNEALIRNTSSLAGSVEPQRLYALFNKDFIKGEVLDLGFFADGSVRVSRNNQVVGTVVSKNLQSGLLKAFIGLNPLDEAVRAGMLGKL